MGGGGISQEGFRNDSGGFCNKGVSQVRAGWNVPLTLKKRLRQMAVGQKLVPKMQSLVNRNMDQNLRSRDGLILTHTQMSKKKAVVCVNVRHDPSLDVSNQLHG